MLQGTLFAALSAGVERNRRLLFYLHLPRILRSINSAMSSPQTTLSLAQWNVCVSIRKHLKRMPESREFRKPVDAVRWNIPDYYQVVRQPMDFSTIERKLISSNPTKPDPNPENPRYSTADEFINDVRLVVKNCVTFNGAEHPITLMARGLEEVFDKQIKNLPAPAEVRALLYMRVWLTICVSIR